MRIEPESGSASIVVVGAFAPAMFSAHWFSARNIISIAEAESAETNVIHPDFASIKIGQNELTITQDRFSIVTTVVPFVVLMDFICKVFVEYLPHVPINALGINRDVHFRVRSEGVRNQLGRRLAPTEPWGEWGQAIASGRARLRSGFRTLTMHESWAKDELVGHTQAKIEPSLQIQPTGVYMAINHQVSPRAWPTESAPLMEYLGENYERRIREAEKIIDIIMELSETIDVGRTKE